MIRFTQVSNFLLKASIVAFALGGIALACSEASWCLALIQDKACSVVARTARGTIYIVGGFWLFSASLVIIAYAWPERNKR